MSAKEFVLFILISNLGNKKHAYAPIIENCALHKRKVSEKINIDLIMRRGKITELFRHTV